MMTLPESLSQQFDVELAAFEETKKMKYVTTIERRAEARGLEIGEARKARSLLQRLLTRRFGELTANVMADFDALTIADLDRLGEALFDFASLQDLEIWLGQVNAE
jgi:Domain of unknown function (DUF4351)